jgi:hypothetical protein
MAFDLVRTLDVIMRERVDLSGPETLALVSLALMANTRGEAHPSYGRLAREARCVRSTAIRAVGSLVDKGLLAVVPRRDESGDRTSNLYRLEVVASRDQVVAQEDHPIAHDDHRGRARRPRVVAQGDHGGRPMRPRRNPMEGTQPEGTQGRDLDSDSVRAVFDHWATKRAATTRTPVARLKLTAERRRKIQARLREGYTADDLQLAIDGIFATPFNVEKGFLDVELACRDAAHVDRYSATARAESTTRSHLRAVPPAAEDAADAGPLLAVDDLPLPAVRRA